jgi:uncharacterized protein DUF1573
VSPSRTLAARRRLVAVLLPLLALFAAAVETQQLPPPVAIAPEPVWDAGVVARGAKIAHTFVIQNHGVEPLMIREVRPGCGCTVASFDSPIAPGGEGKVRVELDTEGLTGAIGKEVTAFTADPANPTILFTIRAQVRASLDAQPGYYWFRHVQGAPAEVAKQLVWSPDFQALEVTSATSTYPGVTVAVRPAQAAERVAEGRGKQWVVEATLAAEPPAGPISGEVKIATNHPSKREITVPLAGFVRSRLTVMPPAADFGTFTRAARASSSSTTGPPPSTCSPSSPTSRGSPRGSSSTPRASRSTSR